MRVLEVGCGVGLAVALLVERVGPEGYVVGLDRSASALAHAERRNLRATEVGVLAFTERELADFRDPGAPFDAVLAVDVNVFWTGPATEEVTRLAELLAPDGVVLLGYEAPPGGDLGRARRGTLAAFAGWRVAAEEDDGLLWVTARR